MALKQMGLHNFKALERVQLELGRVTVLIGGNGTGKSSVLQALGLLKQSRQQREFVWNGLEVKAGAFADVVTFGATKRQMEFTLVLDDLIPSPLAQDGRARYTCSFTLVVDVYGLVRQGLSYDLPEVTIRGTFDFKGNRGEVTPSQIQGGIRITAGAAMLGSVVYVSADNPDFYRATRKLGDTVIDLLEGTYVVPLERAVKELTYPEGVAPSDFRSPGDVGNFLVYKQEAREKVSRWLSEVVGEELSVDFHRSTNPAGVLIEIRRGRESINVAHEGAGLQHVLWPLAQLAVAPVGAVVCIEEPEIHLHPQAQAHLSRALARIPKEEDKHLLLTTQSEHLLMGFLTQVAEGTLSPDELAVYYFEKSPGAAAAASRLKVDPDGTIEGGLRGFFEVSFDEMERYLKAQAKAAGHK